MNKKKEILFNSNNFLLSMSLLFDKVEQYQKNTTPNHIKRVAYLSLKIGQKFNLNNEQLFDLCAYALAHSSVLYGVKVEDEAYCNKVQAFIDLFPLKSNEKDILKYHKEFYNGSGVFGLKEEEIPLFSQIISFADILDTQFDLSNSSLHNREAIYAYIQTNQNRLFSVDMYEIFCDELAIEESLWLDLKEESQLLHFIFNTLEDFSEPLSFEKLLAITSNLLHTVHENSKLLHITSLMTNYYEFEEKDAITFNIAACLTQIGKLSLPHTFKDKSQLNEEDKVLCKQYPYYTKLTLTHIMGFSDITSWSTKVQECLDGSGYPYALKSNQLSFKDQLMGILIRYEAMINKTYKTPLSHKEAIQELTLLANNRKIDLALVQDIEKVLE